MKHLFLMIFAVFALAMPASAADKDNYIAIIDFEDVVISSGGTKSAAVSLAGTTLTGIYMPATFTGTAVTFEAATSLTGTYLPVQDGAGSAISKTVAASQYIKIDPGDFAGVRFLKIVSGSTEGADRTVTLSLRPVN